VESHRSASLLISAPRGRTKELTIDDNREGAAVVQGEEPGLMVVVGQVTVPGVGDAASVLDDACSHLDRAVTVIQTKVPPHGPGR
jgi:hypothetical protein